MRPSIRTLGLAGIAGGVLWMALLIASAFIWGPPGTVEYAVYEFLSRGWVVALPLMACGFVGLYLRFGQRRTPVLVGMCVILAGFAAMITGNVLEFFVFSDRSYADAGRLSLWNTFLIGALLAHVGILLLGLGLVRSSALPWWVVIGLITLILAAITAVGFIPLAGLAAIAGGFAARSERPARRVPLDAAAR